MKRGPIGDSHSVIQSGNGGAAGAVRKRDVFEDERRIAQCVAALHDLAGLLEVYAPSWYTSELHDRVRSAMSGKQENLGAIFLELFDLLEEYAPVWYAKEAHAKAASVRQLLTLT
jgi:hypothetical protein